MKTYKNLYPKLCSYTNLLKAFRKARKNKSSKPYVKDFEKDLNRNLFEIKKELETLTYRPKPLKRFVIRDPKTRVIRKSIFKDRIVHHAVVNILEPIYEKVFIHDSYANRTNKGTLAALKRFDAFKKKVSKNGKFVKNAFNDNMVEGYVLKADIRKFFDSVNHKKLIEILNRKIKDRKVLGLISIILKNFDNPNVGMPLGNMTSQFFANVYLNDLDYFVKHKLKAKYYVRYVDDFVILCSNRKTLEEYIDKIHKYLKNLGLELHQDKSKIFSMYRGVDFVGFKNFYYYRLLRKRNIRKMLMKIKLFKEGLLPYEKLLESHQGWQAYAKWANAYKLREKVSDLIKEASVPRRGREA